MPTKYHSSIEPCPQYGNPHSCYICACTQHAEGIINDIAVGLEESGIKCFIEQTGGMTMVGYADTKIGTFSWNEEMLAYTKEHYDTDAFWEHLDIEVPIEYEDAPDEFVGLVINHIKEKVNA
jgi:hypothetical protein